MVDELLDAGGEGHACGAEEECGGDAGDRAEGEAVACEEGVEVLDDGSEQDTAYAGEDLDHVVRDAVEVHLAGLGDEVVEHLEDADVEHEKGESGRRQLEVSKMLIGNCVALLMRTLLDMRLGHA